MPHLWLEFSSNIAQPIQFDELFSRFQQAVARTAGVGTQACKSRALARSTFRVADGHPDQAFVHLEIGLLAGRPKDQHREVAAACLEVLREAYAPSLESLDLQITVEVRSMERESYQKMSS